MKSISTKDRGAPSELKRHVEGFARQRGKEAKRSYAMVLTMARLGLREPEVVGIELDDGAAAVAYGAALSGIPAARPVSLAVGGVALAIGASCQP